jgi:(2Fe-2S) ferredoxin
VSGEGGEPTTLAVAAVVYTLALLGMALWLGPESGLASAGLFENYNGLLSSIAPIGFPLTGDAGPATGVAPVYRGWLRALPHLPIRRGLTAFVIAMIGTVTYDGMSGTEWWAELVGNRRGETWFGTFALLGCVAVIGVAYLGAAWLAGRLARSERTGVEIAASFAHTLVPIALAYAVAHYFTLVLFEGQLVLPALGDPLGRGWDLLGTADWRPVVFLSPRVVWYVQVTTIVAGHIAGVVLAHDRALAEFGPEGGVRSQYALLALMVSLTSLGLLILAG